METTSKFDLGNFLNSYPRGGLYVQDCNIHVQRWSGFDDYSITDLDSAMQPGKACASYRIASRAGRNGNLDVTNWIMRSFGNSLPLLLLFCNGLEWESTSYGFEAYHLVDGEFSIEINKRDKESKRTFSPFAKLPKLTAEPKKWTLPHVFKALLNGQFKNLRCKGVYTDDYAYDATVNYQQGDFSSAAADFVRRVMESPSGWRTYGNNGSVSVCCHSFDLNEFTFSL